MPDLDEKDRLLIAALKKNARASLVSLGRDIGLARSATHDRILRLEEQGVIRGYTAIIDENASVQVKAFFTITTNSRTAKPDVTQTIARLESVVTASCLTGDIDVIAYCECDNAKALSQLREKIGAMEGVEKVMTRTVLDTFEGR